MSHEVLESFMQSFVRFEEILKEPKTIANRDSAIKRFELTFELAWKSSKEYLGNKGILCRSPRDCLQELFTLGVVQDEPHWLKMIEDRNLSVHTYNERLAEDIYSRLKDYLKLFKTLRHGLMDQH